MPKQTNMLFDIKSIQNNFLDVQKNFDEINSRIKCQRDYFSNDVINNLLCAYDYINVRLAKKSQKQLINYNFMLDLNGVVHFGTDSLKRQEYGSFLHETEKKFQLYIEPLLKWYKRHERSDCDPYKVAAGLYVRVLANPQLFIEGNHRTGALLANCHLMLAGKQPFILTVGNAVEFFNLASDVKFKKMDIKSKFKRAAGWHDELSRMTHFLKMNAKAFAYKEPERDDLTKPCCALIKHKAIP